MKKRALGLLCMVILIGAALFYIRNAQKAREPFELIFLPACGDLNIQEGADNPVSLYYIVKNAKSEAYSKLEDALIQSEALLINGTSVLVSNLEIFEQFSVKEAGSQYTLYTLVFDISAENLFAPEATVVWNELTIHSHSYPIGSLTLHIFEKLDSGGNLHLDQRMALVPNSPVENYHAMFTNRGAEPVTVQSVDTGNFTGADIKWDIYDTQNTAEGLPFVFAPQSEHQMELLLSSNARDNMVLYYVSPVVEYEEESSLHYQAIYHCLFGVPGNKVVLLDVCHMLFQ